MDIIQAFIFILGLIAIFLTQHKNQALHKFACIFGLLSQPFFLYSTYMAGQNGMFLLSICYTVIWVLGVKNYWLTNPDCQEHTEDKKDFVNYLSELETLKAHITADLEANLITSNQAQLMLDLVNDARVVSDPEYCVNALFALKYKFIKLYELNLNKRENNIKFVSTLLRAVVALEAKAMIIERFERVLKHGNEKSQAIGN